MSAWDTNVSIGGFSSTTGCSGVGNLGVSGFLKIGFSNQVNVVVLTNKVDLISSYLIIIIIIINYLRYTSCLKHLI